MIAQPILAILKSIVCLELELQPLLGRAASLKLKVFQIFRLLPRQVSLKTRRTSILLPLLNNSITDRKILAMAPSNLSISTLYGATITTTFFSSYTVTSHQTDYTIQFPTMTGSPYVPYTTISTIAAGGATSLTTAPVLVLTNVAGVALSTNGQAIKTATLVEQLTTPASLTTILTQPTSTTTMTNSASDTATSSTVPCSAWSCWDQSQQAATIVGSVFGFLVLLGLLWWALCLVPNGIGVFVRGHRRYSRSSLVLDNETVLTPEEVVAFGHEALPQEGTLATPAYQVEQVSDF